MVQIVDVRVLKLLGEPGSETHVQLSVDSAVLGNPAPGAVLASAVLETGSGHEVLEVGGFGTVHESIEKLVGEQAETGKAWLVTDLADVPGVTFTPGQILQGASFGPSLLLIELPGATPPPPPTP